MNDSDDLTVLISHDEHPIATTNSSPAHVKMPKDNSVLQNSERLNFDLPFMNAYQKQPFISALRTLYRNINNLDMGTSQSDMQQLKQKLIQTMDKHTRLLSEQGIENTHIMIMRYMLSTFIDETLGYMPWQNNLTWANYSLLHYYYQETYGGEKFFQLLEQFIKEPHKYIQHIELAYVCISLGYKGRFAIQKNSRGEIELDRIRNELYARIRNLTSKDEKFYEGHPVSNKKHKLFLHIPYKMFILGGIILMAIVYGLFTSTVNTNENELLKIIKIDKKELKEVNATTI
jgi:type VI secretion system protein ImpK